MEWPPWAVYLPCISLVFSSWVQHRFLQSSSQSVGAPLCHLAGMWHWSHVAGICVGRPDRMPATSLAIHSLVGLGISLEPGFLKPYFNGFTLVISPETACEREWLFIFNTFMQFNLPDRDRLSGQISACCTNLQECWWPPWKDGWSSQPFTPCLLAEKQARKQLKTDLLVSVLLWCGHWERYLGGYSLYKGFNSL